jgi:ADP-ribose pyrophosphatase YjhB (NUDIX family)
MNPKVVGATLPIEEGRVWLLRRGIEPRYGYWTYPAGYQEVDESTEEAAIRETREEIGCEVALDGLLGVYSRPHAPVVTIVYLAHFIAPRSVPCVTTEAVEVRSFLPGEVPWTDLAFPSTEQALRDWVARMGPAATP